jgi:hypothetical protein
MIADVEILGVNQQTNTSNVPGPGRDEESTRLEVKYENTEDNLRKFYDRNKTQPEEWQHRANINWFNGAVIRLGHVLDERQSVFRNSVEAFGSMEMGRRS